MTIRLLIGLLLLTGCSEKLSSTNVERNDTPLSQTPGVVAVPYSPAAGATGFKVSDPIIIKFSGPVQAGLVEDFMIRVENEIGQVYQTQRTWNSDFTEVSLRRVVNGQQIGWDMATTHSIFVEPYILDSYGENIWPRDWEFRTEEIGQQGSGNFKIIEANPTSGVITPETWLDVKLSQPIWPGVASCSTSTWQGAFDIFIVDFFNAVGNLNVPAQPAPMVCLLCNSATGVCDKLRFRATSGWPTPYSLLNVLVVRIKKNYALRSATTGEQLDGTYQIEKAIMP